MMFNILNRERKPLAERGYRIHDELDMELDKEIYNEVLIQKGKAHAEKIIAEFSDCDPICLGEDGVFYTVLYENVSMEGEPPAPFPVAWREIEVIL